MVSGHEEIFASDDGMRVSLFCGLTTCINAFRELGVLTRGLVSQMQKTAYTSLLQENCNTLINIPQTKSQTFALTGDLVFWGVQPFGINT